MTRSFQIKKILIPTDFTQSADNAMEYASKLAKQTKANILVYHAYPIPIADVNMPASVFLQVTREAEANAKQHLDTLCSQLKEKISDECTCSYILAQDFNSHKVVKAASEHGADLIVMGTHGASGMAEYLMGTNTSRVVAEADCPVLAVPENVSYKPIDKILFTTDYHDTDFPTLQNIVPLAELFNAEIVVMHVFQHDRTLEKNMLEWFKEELENHINYKKILFVLEQNEKITEAVNDYIDKNNVSILVASTRKRNLLEKIFHTSITKKLTHHPQVPFLVFHYTKEEENKVETT